MTTLALPQLEVASRVAQPTSGTEMLVEQVSSALNEWSKALHLICVPALARLSGIPATTVALGLNALAAQRRIKRVGPGIFVTQPNLN